MNDERVNRINNINQILKDLYSSVKDSNVTLTAPAVYHYLTGRSAYNIQEVNTEYNSMFDKWIGRFRNKENIKVFVDERHSYFCQFTNDINIYKNEILDCIKMYIPLDYDHIEKGANRIFDFLERNNIKHHSKIASEIRADDVVVRLYRKEDAVKLQNFVERDRYIKEGMLSVNPFCFSKDGVGYGYDDRSSYNYYVSSVVADYINVAKERNMDISSVNMGSFYKHIDDVGHDFIKMNSFLDDRESTRKDVYLTDAYVMNDLLKLSLKSNDINDYYSFYDKERDVKFRRGLEKNVLSRYREQLVGNTAEVIMASYNNDNNMASEKEELFKEFILTTMKKYPLGYDKSSPNKSGWDYIISYINGYNSSVTRDNDLRKRVNQNLSRVDIYDIADKSGIMGENLANKVNNYIKKVMLDDIIKSMKERMPNDYVNNLRGFLIEDNLNYITSNGKARDLATTFRAGDMRRFMYDMGVNNIEEYINKYYYEEENRRMKR